MALVTGDSQGADQTWCFYAQYKHHKINVLLPSSRKTCAITIPHKLYHIDDQDPTRSAILTNLASDVVRKKAVLAEHFAYRDYMHRDIAQAQFAESCYAFAFLKLDNPSWPVEGGTAWATAAFYRLRGLEKLYIYDLRENCWVTLANVNNKWTVKRITPPPPSGQYAGIGSRNANPNEIVAALQKL